MRKPVSAESIFQSTNGLVVWDRVEASLTLVIDGFLPSCLHKDHQSCLSLSQETGLSSLKMVTAQCSTFFKMLADSFTKETHVQRKAGEKVVQSICQCAKHRMKEDAIGQKCGSHAWDQECF